MASCTSPIQIDHTINWDAPVVTMTVNHMSLSIGDTLQLTVHVADPTLKSGSIDFGDSTIVGWNDLGPVFDTTLLHVFRSVRSYELTASFSDGDRITTERLGIAVSPSSPKVTITPHKTTVRVGDTLEVTLHASDATLSNGTLDFGDGTVIAFPNLSHTFDTTIGHVYSYPGSYSVSATFSNGYTSRSASFTIAATNHFFALSLSTGMVWHYSYDFSYDDPPSGHSDNLTGIHEWRTISEVVVDRDTIFAIQQIRNDTRHSSYPVNGRWVDTTYVFTDTSQFTVTVSDSSIRFNLPLLSETRTDIIPNHTYLSNYPFTVWDASYRGPAVYDDRAGLLRFSFEWSTIHSITTSEHLALIDYTKP
jgi:PKD domain-containing protein